MEAAAPGQTSGVRGGRSGGDVRVAAVLAVLSGEDPLGVATRFAVDANLLDRWVRAFVEAGTAQVTNRPTGAVARERDRFLSTFMHGIRSPLATAQGWLDFLRYGIDGTPDPATVGQATEKLESLLRQLDERARDVELLTAAMLGRISLELSDTTVGEVLGRLGVEEVLGEGPDLPLRVDVDLFARVVRDLWDAAESTAPRASEVIVGVSTRDPWIELRVVRIGDPIAPATLYALFDPFEQIPPMEDPAVAPEWRAVTTGLYLARALTVAHGGTVGVEQDEDTATFWVRIPDPRVAEEPDRTDQSTDRSHGEPDPRVEKEES